MVGVSAGGENSALPFATGELRYEIAPWFERLAVPATIVWGEQ